MNDTLPEQDAEAELVEAVKQAIADQTPLRLRGSGSKDFYGPATSAGEDLDLTGHRGVVAYEPTELAISVRAGTPLAEVERLLDDNAQQFPFEPPRYGLGATIGGMVAAGLSGPRRPYAGSVRDSVLGVRIINGRGQALGFGGRVMKNVAGYDLSRLMAGSLGTLGVLLDVSLKVLPRPAAAQTRAFEARPEQALELVRGWRREAQPMTASCHRGDKLEVRLEGGEQAVEVAAREIGGEPVTAGAAPWDAVREQTLGWFNDQRPLWRLSSPPATPWLSGLDGHWLVEWGGALRWLLSDAPAADIRAAASQAGGHATLFRGGDGETPVFTPLSPIVEQFHRQVKQSLDPDGLFNPGRLYPGF